MWSISIDKLIFTLYSVTDFLQSKVGTVRDAVMLCERQDIHVFPHQSRRDL